VRARAGLGLGLVFRRGRGARLGALPTAPYISPISPLYLPYISLYLPISRLGALPTAPPLLL